MQIGFAFLCRTADVDGHGGFSVEGGDVNLLGLDRLPGELELGLVVQITGRPDELRETHPRSLRLLDGSGNVLGERLDEIGGRDRLPMRPPGFASTMTVVTEIAGFEISEAGWYRLEIRIGQDVRVLAFFVFEAIVPTPEMAEIIETVEAAGAKVQLYPPGIYEATSGLPAAAASLIWRPGELGPVVGLGRTPEEALRNAREAWAA